MVEKTRRDFFTTAGLAFAGSVALANGAFAETRPERPNISRAAGIGGDDPGSHDPLRDRENPDLLNPPATDSGTLPNLKFSFSDAHVRQQSGGWTRQVTHRELGIATTIAGVDMRLNSAGIRELHWHKEAEWSVMTYGRARITMIDPQGRWFVKVVEQGDLWYFPAGYPHSIQGLGPDGCEFLLAFDDGDFDEDSTFLLSDWFKHVPPEVLAKNFGVSIDDIRPTPSPDEEYIFAGTDVDEKAPLTFTREKTPFEYSYQLLEEEPIQIDGGRIWIADSHNFKVAKTIAAALVELEPGAMRELHWHPNNDEWQYYLQGEGRMGVFAAKGQARTFDFRAGDVGYVPFAMGHYVQNTGDKPLRFFELFKSDYYADVSLKQWLALTPQQLVQDHLKLGPNFMDTLKDEDKTPIVK
ncbi:cupin domain-containing protein [Bartonella tamiae]|uniref:Oxalate decarboxylase family bicupin n=1 Tax=Bartonella tamiae Th239 TaxID=1094558 RepID=J0QY78_9HYPH|nr:cupin domain-containing protein [Bartonella tamiae]EJF91051.1 oxalate decarboxylase family bicupin [Bartonella tamiae Th239]EJF93284.1 oxalate decarboxylase family bicupin [Bartonella tamiae Th307]